MTDYKASKRIVGTSAERESILPQGYDGNEEQTTSWGTGSGQSVWKVTNVKLQNGRTTWL